MNVKKCRLIVCILSFAAVYAGLFAEAAITQLSGAKLETIMNSKTEKENYLVIDVREREEYAQGHVRTAINISVNELQYRLSEIDDLKSKKIVTICRSGKRSQRAAELLSGYGFTQIFNAQGVGTHNYSLITKVANVRGKKLQEFADVGTHLILDVRDPKDYAAGHLKRALNIPAHEIAARMKELPKTKNIAVYCYTGDKSFEAAQKLADAGYAVTNALDGTKQYNGYKLVK
ncbi:MAG: rhodanese-like domain-containing protein [Treponema sp.]